MRFHIHIKQPLAATKKRSSADTDVRWPIQEHGIGPAALSAIAAAIAMRILDIHFTSTMEKIS